jgi:hypothetical protein
MNEQNAELKNNDDFRTLLRDIQEESNFFLNYDLVEVKNDFVFFKDFKND